MSTNTKRNQGRSLSVVHASVPSEVSNQAVHMKGNACPLERRKFTVRMVVVCATSAFGKSKSLVLFSEVMGLSLYSLFRIVRAFLIEEQKIVAKVLKAQQAAVKSKA